MLFTFCFLLFTFHSKSLILLLCIINCQLIKTLYKDERAVMKSVLPSLPPIVSDDGRSGTDILPVCFPSLSKM